MKGFRFTFWADVLPSNRAVIVSLVHLSLSPATLAATVKRPAALAAMPAGCPAFVDRHHLT